ncbi:transposase [Rhodococcus fascians]|nr:transposase [Rhodococcus fascians]
MTVVGLSRSTWHYRRSPRPAVEQPVHQRDRRYPNRIDSTDRVQVEALITTGWKAGNSVDHSFATAWDNGSMMASRRSWWRIAAAVLDQRSRPKTPTKKSTRAPRRMPIHTATAPGQVWSWDITDLHSPWRGASFKAYSIIDIHSRLIAGWRVEERESDHLAAEMFEAAIKRYGAPSFVHADSGPAMRSNTLEACLTAHGIELTHNRPYVSNDNPFSESEFRTMKYRPNYPGIFSDIDAARGHLTDYVHWYNTDHKHSGIALFSPADVHSGKWRQMWTDRDRAQQAYYDRHPERFRTRPYTPRPASSVGINDNRLQTA